MRRNKGSVPFLRRILSALTALLLLVPASAAGELPWPAAPTAGQLQLQGYVEAVNGGLARQQMPPINSLFECWPALAVLGITRGEAAETPEGVEITVHLSQDSMDWLELRVNDTARFPAIAAALIQAAAGDQVSLQDALKDPTAYAQRVSKRPDYSFSDEPVTAKGETIRTYYAYEFNPYGDNVNWLCMTLVFPWQYGSAGIMVTPVPEIVEEKHRTAAEDEDPDYVGYYQPLDDAEHFEIFVTPTPDPDSAVYDTY